MPALYTDPDDVGYLARRIEADLRAAMRRPLGVDLFYGETTPAPVAPYPLVGIMGKKRSGKDSLARTLIEERGYVRFAFADPLKRAALASNPVVFYRYADGNPALEPRPRRLADVVVHDGWERAKENREVRRYLQSYGIAIREIDADFWLNATLGPVEKVRVEAPVVITDVRFPNEAEAIRRAGGILVRVVRPDLASTDTHESETALDDYEPDLVIVNDGTLDDLAAAVRALLP